MSSVDSPKQTQSDTPSLPDHRSINEMTTTAEQQFVNDPVTMSSTDDPADETTRELTWRSASATAGSALTYFVTVGFLNAFGVFQQYYSENILRGHSEFQISWLGSMSLFTFFAAAPVAGILADKYGPTLPMICGAIVQLFAIFMVSLCTKYYQFFLAQGVLLGLSMGFVAVPASGIVPRYFNRHRALATGISIGGSSLGGIIWPIVFDQLFHHGNVSFAWSFRIAGFIQIPLFALVILTVRPPPNKEQSLQETANNDALKEQGTTAPEKDEQKDKTSTKTVFRQPAFILTAIGLFFAYLGWSSPIFYAPTYAVSLGMTPNLAFYLVSIVNGTSLLGRILPGIVADRWGKFNMLALSALSAGIVAFCWTQATSVAGVVVWVSAYGFTSGAILSLQLACVTSLAPPEAASTLIGATMGSVSLAGLFSAPINGALLSHGGWIGVSCLTGGALVVGGVFVWAGRMALNKNILTIV